MHYHHSFLSAYGHGFIDGAMWGVASTIFTGIVVVLIVLSFTKKRG